MYRAAMHVPYTALRWALLTTAFLLLAACANSTGQQHQRAVAIEPGDTCAVCGMYIEHHPGPRGEAYVRGSVEPLKFGSTRDFFAYVTQPDVTGQLGRVFVQDTARIDWDHPSSSADTFIDARHAYYVAWQPLAGAMGPTLASFARRADARAFIARHGGRMLRFEQITPELISSLGYRCPKSNTQTGTGHGTTVAACVTKAPAAHDGDIRNRPHN